MFIQSRGRSALHFRLNSISVPQLRNTSCSLIVQGKSNKEIAANLGITEATVKCHVSVILERLGVSDRTQAVVTALQRGLEHL